MAAPIYWGPRAKFLKWILFKHNFELYPFDRELFSDIGYIVVRLLEWDMGLKNKRAKEIWHSVCLSVRSASP